MTRGRLSRLGTIAMVGAFAAACEPSTAPELGPELDTEAAIEDYEALDAVLSSAELAGFLALGDRTPYGGSPAAIDAVAGLSAADQRDSGRAYALELMRRIQASDAMARPSNAPIISDRHRGSTFVYSPEEDDYVVDPERTGAPETGVRFITYEVDANDKPIVTEETGHADLIDEGDTSTEDVALRLIVEFDGAVALDYATTLDENGNRGTLTVRGFMQGDGVRLDFDIEAVGNETPEKTTLDVSFDLRIDSHDFSIVGNVKGVEDGEEGEGDIDVTVRHGQQSLRVDLNGGEGTIDGTIFLNGDIFVIVSGPSDDPVFADPDGGPLSLSELIVLHRVVEVIEDVFMFLEDLVSPVEGILLLGIIL